MRNGQLQKKVTVIGAAIIDVLTGPVTQQVFKTGSQPMETTRLSFGGDALNEAVVLSRFGVPVQLISKVGDDEAGKQVLGFLQANGVATDCVKQERGLVTGINIVLVDAMGERHFLTNPNGSLRKLSVKDVEPFLKETGEIVSFASMFVSPMLDIPAMEKIFKQVKSQPGRILVADMTKAKCGERLEDLQGLLPYVDYIVPNEAEAALLTGIEDSYENARLLIEAGVKCAVIKRGSRGCLIRTKEEYLEIPAYPAERVIDTTGAGDCFTAGFLWGLSQGFSLEKCGRLACATASYAVEAMGATEGVPTAEEVKQRMVSIPKV